MFSNHIKLAWRNISKHRLFSAINIVGLAVGIAVCFIIMLFVQHELSYDRFNTHADNIVRVVFNANMNGGKISEASVMAPVAGTLKKEFPEVEESVRILNFGSIKIEYGDKAFKDDQIAFVDPQFFGVFTLPDVEGNARQGLAQPSTVVMTRSTAVKYFGKEEPIGKVIRMQGQQTPFRVVAVVEDVPGNSHYRFDLFASMTGWEPAKSDSWMYGNFYTYLELKPGTDRHQLEAKLPAIVEKYMGPQILKDMGMTLAQFRTKGNQLGFLLQPLTDIHLHSATNTELEPGGNASYVYIFAVIAVFMLVVACINFINLSTASASTRAREVGVRKVIGSARYQLVMQFLFESLVVTILALGLTFLLVKVLMPAFNELSGKQLVLGSGPIVQLIVCGLLVGLVAGIYPAWYLSSFKPIAVLKGKLKGGNSRFSLRSGLVVFQFFISVGLIVSTIVVYRQMRYIQNKQLGYDKEQLLTIPNSYVLGKNEQVYKQMMLADPRVVNATVSYYKPAGPSNFNNALTYAAGHENTPTNMVEYLVDERYIPTFGMQMATGRNFSPDLKTDSLGLVINEAAARAYGWNDVTAVGKQVVRVNSIYGANVTFHVVGVVKDFHFKSLHEPIAPLLMALHPEGGLIFKIRTHDIAGVLADMKSKWDGFHPEEPFRYAFMDDLYNKTYAGEQKTGTILDIFALLTILVACMGLFGLATYTATQRTKEIGIRKVLGATVAQVMGLLSKEFVVLVLIASALAFPVAWYCMNKWLESFAYRVEFGWWVFPVAGVIALVIALVTVGYQAVRAALANPVKSLRTE